MRNRIWRGQGIFSVLTLLMAFGSAQSLASRCRAADFSYLPTTWPPKIKPYSANLKQDGSAGSIGVNIYTGAFEHMYAVKSNKYVANLSAAQVRDWENAILVEVNAMRGSPKDYVLHLYRALAAQKKAGHKNWNYQKQGIESGGKQIYYAIKYFEQTCGLNVKREPSFEFDPVTRSFTGDKGEITGGKSLPPFKTQPGLTKAARYMVDFPSNPYRAHIDIDGNNALRRGARFGSAIENGQVNASPHVGENGAWCSTARGCVLQWLLDGHRELILAENTTLCGIACSFKTRFDGKPAQGHFRFPVAITAYHGKGQWTDKTSVQQKTGAKTYFLGRKMGDKVQFNTQVPEYFLSWMKTATDLKGAGKTFKAKDSQGKERVFLKQYFIWDQNGSSPERTGQIALRVNSNDRFGRRFYFDARLKQNSELCAALDSFKSTIQDGWVSTNSGFYVVQSEKPLTVPLSNLK